MKHSYHVHSTYSDGKCSIIENLNFLTIYQLNEIGISDHLMLEKNCDFEWAIDSVEKLDKYVLEISKFKEKYPLKLGIEVDFFPKIIDEIKLILDQRPFDYVIGSVHVVEDFKIDISIQEINENSHLIVKKYWELIKQMAESAFCDIIGHIDLIKKFNPHLDHTYREEIDHALQAIADNEICIELNTSGWHYPCHEQFPSVELLKKCKKLHIPVIVTADAHRPENLVRDFERAYILLKEIGYESQPSFTNRKKIFYPFPI